MSLIPTRTIVLSVGAATVVGLLVGAVLGLWSLTARLPIVEGRGGPPSAGATGSSSPSPSSSPSTVTAASSKDTVAQHERIGISGTVTPAAAGLTTGVQREQGGKWKAFPADTTTAASGAYELWIESGRKGENTFRVVTSVGGADVVSAPFVVRIG
jgi:hypothetical protein